MKTWIHILPITLLLLGCAVQREIDPAGEGLFDPMMEISLVAYNFFESEGRWPHSIEEFSDFALERNLPLSREEYRDLTFETQDDGPLVVSYRQMPPREAEIEMTLRPPVGLDPR